MDIGLGDIDVIELNTSDINLSSEPVNMGNIGQNRPAVSVPSVAPPLKPSSSTSGGGLELLMNDKRMKTSSSSMALDDIDSLENELNALSSSDPVEPSHRGKAVTKSSLFDVDKLGGAVGAVGGIGAVGGTSVPTFKKVDDTPSGGAPINIGLGRQSSRIGDPAKTWDGYGKFNEIPVNPDLDDTIAAQPKLSKEELLREKFSYLRKLESLEQKGVVLTKKYSMESDLAEMQGEYEMVIAEKERTNSVKFQGKMLMAAVTGLEFLNNKIDPFDVNLDGWGEQVNENVSDYDEIFAELHEKYKSKAKIAPELKLLFQLGGSAIMVHMTNSMFKTAVPGMDDIMRQNPDLMKQFSQAAVNSMGETNPGFGGFMNDVVGNGGGGGNGGQPQQRSGGVPMPPQNAQHIPPRRAPPPQSMNQMAGSGMRAPPSTPDPSIRRADMKGPSDISSILSNIKKKQDAKQSNVNVRQSADDDFEVGSAISIQDMKDMNSDMGGPSRARRRPKSERNTITLDI